MKLFTRTRENFICLHCGQETAGDGYTNHCPGCLWSRHVDVHPGDRAESCLGPMEPVEIEGNLPGKLKVVHQCTLCGVKRRCKLRDEDNIEVITTLMRQR